MPTDAPTRPLPAPHDVTLADVYALDFGQRTADLPTWDALAAACPRGPVLDVACGDGRATAALAARGRNVLGVDLNPAFLARARQRGLDAKYADLTQHRSVHGWGFALPPAALVVCAYSSLYLLPHDAQERLVACMAEALAPGGVLAIEVFVPVLVGDGTMDQPCADPNDASRPPWVRRTRYTVYPESRTTRIERLYGPERERWTMRLTEIVRWRDPAELVLLARRAGLEQVQVDTVSTTLRVSRAGFDERYVVPIAPGHALLTARA